MFFLNIKGKTRALGESRLQECREFQILALGHDGKVLWIVSD